MFDHIWDEKEREKRRKKELKRLKQIFSVLDEDKRNAAEGAIESAAFQRVMLDELRLLIERDGYISTYDNGGGQSGTKKHPCVEIYDKTMNTYTKIVKMLCDLLPEGKGGPGEELMEYLARR